MRSSRYGSLPAGELPGTLQRSSEEAQAKFLRAHAEAVKSYGVGDTADRIAYTALKQEFEKCGDHWVAKTQSAA